jgi:uncharacterized protein
VRVLCDTNLFISYLLTPERAGVVATIVQAAFQNRYTLILPEDVVQELIAVTRAKSYLSSRISLQTVTVFVQVLQELAEYLPAVAEAIPPVSRDPKDDYLLVLALIGRADYLVTGDEDLLSLKQVETVTILRPSEFAALLAET